MASNPPTPEELARWRGCVEQWELHYTGTMLREALPRLLDEVERLEAEAESRMDELDLRCRERDDARAENKRLRERLTCETCGSMLDEGPGLKCIESMSTHPAWESRNNINTDTNEQ